MAKKDSEGLKTFADLKANWGDTWLTQRSTWVSRPRRAGGGKKGWGKPATQEPAYIWRGTFEGSSHWWHVLPWEDFRNSVVQRQGALTPFLPLLWDGTKSSAYHPVFHHPHKCLVLKGAYYSSNMVSQGGDRLIWCLRVVTIPANSRAAAMCPFIILDAVYGYRIYFMNKQEKGLVNWTIKNGDSHAQHFPLLHTASATSYITTAWGICFRFTNHCKPDFTKEFPDRQMENFYFPKASMISIFQQQAVWNRGHNARDGVFWLPILIPQLKYPLPQICY